MLEVTIVLGNVSPGLSSESTSSVNKFKVPGGIRVP